MHILDIVSHREVVLVWTWGVGPHDHIIVRWEAPLSHVFPLIMSRECGTGSRMWEGLHLSWDWLHLSSHILRRYLERITKELPRRIVSFGSVTTAHY